MVRRQSRVQAIRPRASAQLGLAALPKLRKCHEYETDLGVIAVRSYSLANWPFVQLPLSSLIECVRFSLDVQVTWRFSVILAGRLLSGPGEDCEVQI